MFFIVLIGVILIVVIGVVLVAQQQQVLAPENPHPRNLKPLERTLFTLEIGDFVQYMGDDWVVEGRLHYNSKGYTWLEYLLQDRDEVRWLSVEEDDRIEVFWLKTVNDLDIPAAPPRELTYDGTLYRSTETGTAKMTREGTTLNRQAQQCRYYDYEGPNGKVLSIEDWQGQWDVTVGERISSRSLTFLPGDGRRVYDP